MNTEVWMVPQYVPRAIVTDKSLEAMAWRSKTGCPNGEYRQSRYTNNRAEKLHRPTRRRERQVQRFKSSNQVRNSYSPRIYPWSLASTPTPHRQQGR
jgi:transposase-like protein